MNLIVTVILAVIVGYVCYLIALVVPFLAPFANLVGLVAFLLCIFGGYSNNWNSPSR